MLKDKIKALFMEDNEDHPQVISLRAAQTGRVSKKEEDDGPEKRVRGWVKSVSANAPWVAVSVILFAMFAQGAIATAALGYGLVKVSIAVVLAVIADETMFRGQKEPKGFTWLPMLRRAMVFLGICWLMAVT